MARFLILHGLENHRPPAHWQFLLAADLVRRGHDVSYPSLPEPDAPVLDDWLASLREELTEAGEDVAVVCHSLGCVLWFAAAGRGEANAARVLLVSPPDPAVLPDSAASFRERLFDPESVRASAGEVTIACSDRDPYNPPGAAALYAAPLGVDATVFDGAGHISVDDGFGDWPFALEWCVSGTPSGT